MTEKTRIFVGVITAEKFLSSRALAVNNTWGNQVKNNVVMSCTFL